MSTKILVLSDTHGHVEEIVDIINQAKGIDRIIHLGDLTVDAEEIEARTGRSVLWVRGNNDILDRNSSDERMLTIEGFRILLIHGHFLGVRLSPVRACDYAKEKHADIVLYGHTHCFEQGERDGIYYLNPGALSWPRDGHRSYAYLTLSRGKRPIIEQIPID